MAKHIADTLSTGVPGDISMDDRKSAIVFLESALLGCTDGKEVKQMSDFVIVRSVLASLWGLKRAEGVSVVEVKTALKEYLSLIYTLSMDRQPETHIFFRELERLARKEIEDNE